MTWSHWIGPPEPADDPDPDVWNDRRVDDLLDDADAVRKGEGAD